MLTLNIMNQSLNIYPQQTMQKMKRKINEN